MRVCPACQDEYRDEITDCASCKTPLLAPEDLKSEAIEEVSQTDKGPLLKIFEGSMDACYELRDALSSARVQVGMQKEADVAPAAFGSARPTRYSVHAAQQDLPKVAEILEGRFAQMLEREGLGAMVQGPVLLDAPEVSCPACGHMGALVDGKCTDCDLYLGVPSE